MSEIGVWLLIVMLGNNQAFAVDNIASAQECRILAAKIINNSPTRPQVECYQVRKVKQGS
jgi:hypothetical protein